MAQKTALTELIEYLELHQQSHINESFSNNSDITQGQIMAFGSALSKAKSLLEKEKNVIIDFHCEATEIGLKNESSEYLGKAKPIIRKNAEDYYNEAFK